MLAVADSFGLDPVCGTPTATGTSTVTATVYDSAGHSASVNVSLTVNPSPMTATPVANAGGPYVINTGQSLTLNGSGSYDPDAASGELIVSYEWDLDGDGEYDDAAGVNPVITLTYDQLSVLINPLTVADPVTGEPKYAIGLRITDTTGRIGTAHTTLKVVGLLTITTTSLSTGAVGITYNTTLAASGGLEPYTWSATGLPAGFSINSSTGALIGTPAAAGTSAVTIKVSDVNRCSDSKVFTLIVNQASSGGGGGGSNTSTTPTYEAAVSGISATGTTLSVHVNSDNATTDLGTLAGDIFSGAGTTVITMPSIPGVNSYTLGIPAASLLDSQGEGAMTFSTGTGSVTIPTDMLAGISGTEGKKAGITIGQGDKSGLPDEVKAAIGYRPIVQLTLTLNGVQTEWNNPDAPVTVSIPYTPTADELANPHCIVIWHIDGSGNAVSVPNGRYDPDTGTVTFSTTHFSYYAVSYNQVSFKDVAAGAWYSKAVSFIAAREITTGTGNGDFSPEAKLTRGQFIVMLMKAYGIAPDANPKDNFKDAGSAYYTGYLAAAKRLGISAGVGNNLFAPGKEITRQEMFTLLYNALKAIGKLPQGKALPDGNTGKTLSNFGDAGDIAYWAKDAMKLLVETGIIGGSSGKLTPVNTTTRAEMVQLLYNLLSK